MGGGGGGEFGCSLSFFKAFRRCFFIRTILVKFSNYLFPSSRYIL